MTQKHTPGPWVIAGSLVLAGSNKSICQIDGAIQVGKPATEEERKANARLIAATPDLLAALQRCSQLFRKIRDDFEDPRHECREGIRIIEAAIAKAKEG